MTFLTRIVKAPILPQADCRAAMKANEIVRA
jgi:hypothetical protein